MTAAAGELVLHGRNGYVLPLEVETWIEAVVGLLADTAKWEELSANARTRVQEFNFDREAAGILDAFAYLDATRRVSGD
jgi:glycosyltransferase involved in cell wall biosynthesis